MRAVFNSYQNKNGQFMLTLLQKNTSYKYLDSKTEEIIQIKNLTTI